MYRGGHPAKIEPEHIAKLKRILTVLDQSRGAEDMNLSVTECAKALGVARQTLSRLVNAKASVSVEMAYRLSKAFGSTPRAWLGMQLAFDLARSRELEKKIRVKRVFT